MLTWFTLSRKDEVISFAAGSALLIPVSKLDDVLKELHGSHNVFILLRNESTWKRKCVCLFWKLHELTQFDWSFTFWQVSMNSSIVTTPSLFRSIFWKMSDMERKYCTSVTLYWSKVCHNMIMMICGFKRGPAFRMIKQTALCYWESVTG